MRHLKIICSAFAALLFFLVVIGSVSADGELTPIFAGQDKFSSLSLEKFRQRGYPLSSVTASSTEFWSGKEPRRTIQVRRWVLNDAADVDWFVRTPAVLGTVPFPGWDSEAYTGRVCRLSAGTALFHKDTTLVRVSVNAKLENVGDDYVSDLVARIASQLGGGEPDLGLQVSVLSKHVKPHKGERVEIVVEADARATFQFDIYRVANRHLPKDLGDKVFSQNVSGVNSYTFIWDGESFKGNTAVENGDYDIEIKASRLGREERHVVSVQVNHQTGKPKK